MEIKEKIQSFTNLIVWQEGHKLVLDIYKATKVFPNEEMFGLTNQMRRAAVSITSNIAEGFNRRSAKDKSHFYAIAHGSVAEIQNQLLIARDIKYIGKPEFSQIAERTVLVHKLLTGLIKSVLRS
ncbi:MAG: four helix bundle protein [Candidatus Moranbacteria bacterium]|nr:four helix bundle protein [Candidatus Moranbacteria bacterium]